MQLSLDEVLCCDCVVAVWSWGEPLSDWRLTVRGYEVTRRTEDRGQGGAMRHQYRGHIMGEV